MQKILLAMDAINLHVPSVDFACYLGRLTRSKVTGIFLENLKADEHPVLRKVHGAAYLDWEVDPTNPAYQDKQAMISKHIEFFRDACDSRSVRSTLHRDCGVPAKEIIHESRFADLIIIDPETSFKSRHEGAPSSFAKEVLAHAECPVVIAPQSFDSIDEIIFTYDGSASSVFAIKQFTYLFPGLAEKRTIIVQVNEQGIWEDQDKYNFKEWLQNHYSAIGFEVLKGDAEDKLFDYLFKRKNSFVVMGAYGRSAVSRYFKHSKSDRLMRTITQPLFISHS
jgi:hypothetical protein